VSGAVLGDAEGGGEGGAVGAGGGADDGGAAADPFGDVPGGVEPGAGHGVERDDLGALLVGHAHAVVGRPGLEDVVALGA
jgi:hypothetical protein